MYSIDGLTDIGSIIILHLLEGILLGIFILIVYYLFVRGTLSTAVKVDTKARGITFVKTGTIGFINSVAKSSSNSVSSIAIERPLIIDRRTLYA